MIAPAWPATHGMLLNPWHIWRGSCLCKGQSPAWLHRDEDALLHCSPPLSLRDWFLEELTALDTIKSLKHLLSTPADLQFPGPAVPNGSLPDHGQGPWSCCLTHTSCTAGCSWSHQPLAGSHLCKVLDGGPVLSSWDCLKTPFIAMMLGDGSHRCTVPLLPCERAQLLSPAHTGCLCWWVKCHCSQTCQRGNCLLGWAQQGASQRNGGFSTSNTFTGKVHILKYVYVACLFFPIWRGLGLVWLVLFFCFVSFCVYIIIIITIQHSFFLLLFIGL